MSRGKLSVITGPMFAGKSSLLIGRIVDSPDQHKLVLKPKRDTRAPCLRTHDGLTCAAIEVDAIPPTIPSHIQHVYIDEVQFLGVEYLPVVKDALKRGISVTCAGLSMDYKGDYFTLTAQLMAIADEHKVLRAVCAGCGNEAAHSHRKTADKDVYVVGASDIYEPRCWRCV